MTKKMNRFRDLLLDNKILLIVVIGMCLAVFLIAWRSSLRCASGSIRTAHAAYWEYWKDSNPIGERVLENADGKIGFIDESGREVIPAIYTSATGFSEGHSIVTDEDGNRYEIDAYEQRKPL